MAKISAAQGPSSGGEPAGEYVENVEGDETATEAIGAFGTTDPMATEAVTVPEYVSSGSIVDAREWVLADGQDTEARARAALDAEQARPTPRTTLVRELESLLADKTE